jgi:SWI/SNF-related matrix-associated actin-dependent regulator of chromatin subfamily A3
MVHSHAVGCGFLMCISTIIAPMSLYAQPDFICSGLTLDDRFKTAPREHQALTIEWMQHREAQQAERGGFVLSDMGLGKTLAILYTCVLNGGVTLVVCPSHLVKHWQQQIQDHTTVPAHRVMIYQTMKRKSLTNFEHVDFVITTYSVLGSDFIKPEHGEVQYPPDCLLGKRFHRIVMDESHAIKNKNTRAFSGARALSANIRWFVSGTLFSNRFSEAYSPLHLLGHPLALTHAQFKLHYPPDTERGARKLQAAFIPLTIRHEKDALNLPTQSHHRVAVVLNTDDRDFYDALFEFSQDRIRVLTARYRMQLGRNDGAARMKTMSSIFTVILRLRQAACDWRLVLGESRSTETRNIAADVLRFFHQNRRSHDTCGVCFESDAAVISRGCGHKLCGECWMQWLSRSTRCPSCNANVAAEDLVAVDSEATDEVAASSQNDIADDTYCSSKTAAVLAIVSQQLADNKSVIVCSQWTQYLEILKQQFVRLHPQVAFCELTGKQAANARHLIVHRFQTDENIKVCFASLCSASEGITLTKATCIVIADLYWNDSKMSQMRNRIHRIGQERDTEVHTLVVEDSIENNIETMIAKKKAVCGVIAEGKPITRQSINWLSQIVKLVS